MTKRDKPPMSEEKFEEAIKEYGESAKGSVSYQQIQSDLAAGTKVSSEAGVGSTVDYVI